MHICLTLSMAQRTENMNDINFVLLSPIERMILSVNSEEAVTALNLADVLSDMICFHARVRRNGMRMMLPIDEYSNDNHMKG